MIQLLNSISAPRTSVCLNSTSLTGLAFTAHFHHVQVVGHQSEQLWGVYVQCEVDHCENTKSVIRPGQVIHVANVQIALGPPALNLSPIFIETTDPTLQLFVLYLSEQHDKKQDEQEEEEYEWLFQNDENGGEEREEREDRNNSKEQEEAQEKEREEQEKHANQAAINIAKTWHIRTDSHTLSIPLDIPSLKVFVVVGGEGGQVHYPIPKTSDMCEQPICYEPKKRSRKGGGKVSSYCEAHTCGFWTKCKHVAQPDGRCDKDKNKKPPHPHWST
eukprot:GILJ01010029.1.p1 GENE.GILJ01010029.1~~GILJ01010029.1.p1  ORF type:complete len:274 (-),score=37.65 GILJ01010029.1:569-1390(-)